MDRAEKKSLAYHCERLGDIAHAKVEYFQGEKGSFVLGFECAESMDCGIRRSPFSNSPVYTIDCPIYDEVENKLTWRIAG